ncbi:unnamed protein product [Bathycoccus prasinos]
MILMYPSKCEASTNKKNNNNNNNNINPIVAGAFAGAVARVFVAPLDVIKIRLQIQKENYSLTNAKYKGAFSAMSTIAREEGIRKGLWAGTIPALCLWIPYTGIQFGMLNALNSSSSLSSSSSSSFLNNNFVFGAVAGATATVATYPFDIIRTQLASQGIPKTYNGVFDAFFGLLRRRKLYAGLGITLIEIIPATSVQFGVYEYLNSIGKESSNTNNNNKSSSGSSRSSNSSSSNSFELNHFAKGFLAGSCARVAIHPLDVMKKRLQVVGLKRAASYGAAETANKAFPLVLSILKTEGVRGFYKGLVPALCKSAPSSAITFGVYDSNNSRKRQFLRSAEKKRNAMMGGGEKKKKQLSGAQKRKKKREKEDLAAEMERLKLGPSKLWTGLVLHHKDVFVTHVISKLNTTDRWFFSKVSRESWGVLEYTGVDVSKLIVSVLECSSISTLEWAWNRMSWGEKFESGTVIAQAWFCWQVAATNKLELLKWAREVKQCEWDEQTINVAVFKGTLEMLKYCFSNDCPYEEKEACAQAAIGGHLDCLRFLFDKVKPSRETEKYSAVQAAAYGHLDILKYIVEERKVSDAAKLGCVAPAAKFGRLDCLKYLVEEAKVPYHRVYIAHARYNERHDCLNYLLEKGCPEPTDEEYALFVEIEK